MEYSVDKITMNAFANTVLQLNLSAIYWLDFWWQRLRKKRLLFKLADLLAPKNLKLKKSIKDQL